MKKLFLLILIVILAACSSATPEPPQNLSPTNTVAMLSTTSAPVPTKNMKPTASPELGAYVNKIYLILDDLSRASEEMNQLFMIAKARNNFTNEDWLERANKTFNTLIEGADKIEAIDPVPDQAEIAHEYFLMAAEELRLVVSSQKEFIEGNIDGEESANEYMRLHLSFVQKGLEEINKFQP
ncbi:MAG: hypothetical protein PVJ21_00015 [Anaerolineales bacterium]|jgi:hypothetical protein